jgi:hypothetical protein
VSGSAWVSGVGGVVVGIFRMGLGGVGPRQYDRTARKRREPLAGGVWWRGNPSGGRGELGRGERRLKRLSNT